MWRPSTLTQQAKDYHELKTEAFFTESGIITIRSNQIDLMCHGHFNPRSRPCRVAGKNKIKE